FDFADEFRGKYVKKFDELIDRLRNAKQFNEILAMPQLSDRTKKNCIDEIDREYDRRNETPGGGGKVVDPPVTPVVKEIRKVYKSNLISDCPVISSEDNIDKLLDNLRKKLEKELKEKGEFKLV
ncbi:hypothetical protein, partial [Intestinibacter sp.]|uniref:hypothetical protein n=1 Tax=Intestinibacter sp. TaxID=1965304 RepID=UPI002A759481